MIDADRLRTLQQALDFETIDALIADDPEIERSTDARVRLVLAVIGAVRGDLDKMRQHGADLTEEDFDGSADLADLALVWMTDGHADRAIALLERVTANPDADGVAFARLGTFKTMRGDLEGAALNLEEALKRLPERPEVLSNLGGLRLRQNRLEDALACYDQALTLRPDFPTADQQRARILTTMGRSQEVLTEREEKLEADPDNPDHHVALASVQAHLEMKKEAEATLRNAVERFPEIQGMRRQLINLLFGQRKWWAAGRLLIDWHKEEPDNLEFRAWLNRARIENGFLDKAEEDLDAWSEEEKAGHIYPVLRARLLSERHRQAEAVELLEETLTRFPGLFEARSLLALLLSQLGRLEDARRHREVLARVSPPAAIDAAEQSAERLTDTDLEHIRAVMEATTRPREQRSLAGFALARIYDTRGQWDEAFEALREANELERESLSYDWRDHRRFVQRQTSVFNERLLDRLGAGGHDSSRPIFVCGMPRSGTTLTEQILASHPDVYGAGELSLVPRITRLMPAVIGRRVVYPAAMRFMQPENMESAGRYYLERLARIEDSAPRVVDKLPHNFDHIGLIALMFPNAKIIHMNRDPRDVAVSNYFQNFQQKHGLMGYAFDLEDIGHMLNDHDRTMAHWRTHLPGRIYELDYESLIRDPERQISDLLAFLELPWDDNVLRFTETQRAVKTASIRQVRRGIYTTSAERWRRYEAHLEPLNRVLDEGFLTIEPAAGKAKAPAAVGGTGDPAATQAGTPSV